MLVKSESEQRTCETPLFTDELKRCVDAISSLVPGRNGYAKAGYVGQVRCVAGLRLHLVPFYEPCVIFVLSGVKRMGDKVISAGGALAVPAPSSYHMANDPDPVTGCYKSLAFSFDAADIEYVRCYLGTPASHPTTRDIVTYGFDAATLAGLEHYLGSQNEESVARILHRKREILLILAERNPALLSLATGDASWAQKVRAVLATDPAAAWSIEDVCTRLAVTESTLRRHLRREGSGFREVLGEFRLSNALMAILMSDEPIYRIAYDNGFQSVPRFTDNFKKRFRLTPTQVRARLPENG